MQPLQEIWSDFARFSNITKMPLVPSNMDGFQILKILLVAWIEDYHIMPRKPFYTLLNSGLSFICYNFFQKNSHHATSKLQETPVMVDAGSFDHTT